MKRVTENTLITWMGAMALGMIGCTAQHTHPTYQTLSDMPGRDPHRAQLLNEKGLAKIEAGELALAEQQFRKALDHDLYYAPAHNNLGLVLMQAGSYYQAAWEFESAAKLSPRSTQPRENLALLYEKLGKLNQAIDHYESVLEVEASNLVTMRHLARAYVKAGRKDNKLKNLLEKILLISKDGPWDVWIRGQLIRLGRDDDESSLTALSAP